MAHVLINPYNTSEAASITPIASNYSDLSSIITEIDQYINTTISTAKAQKVLISKSQCSGLQSHCEKANAAKIIIDNIEETKKRFL